MAASEGMSSSRIIGILVGVWLSIVSVYLVVSLALAHHPEALATFGNLVQCVVPLLANAGLLLNAGTPHWRRNIFWMLLAFGCTLWMLGQFEWTYYEVYAHEPAPRIHAGDLVFFLRGIPIMAALALQPHRKRGEVRLRFGYLNFGLLLTWWMFLYANLFGSAAIYMLSSLTINVAIDMNKYATGSLYDLPLISSFLWFGLAGAIAYLRRAELDASVDTETETDAQRSGTESGWAARLAMAAVMSLPALAIYTLRYERDVPDVRDFRLMVTLVAALPIAFLVFLRTHIADADRARLLARSEQSIQNLQRLQAQLVQTEKLVSLGQLAAGAAHEINNPLAAILGFSDLLADDPTLPEKARATAAKIRDQARRTKTLVANLLRFARQVPPERTLLDINTVVTNAVQLRALDLRSSKSRIDMQLESVLPGVRGGGNQFLQVFFNIVNNGIDAMEASGGGVLTIKTIRDRGNVVILFTDTGPGINEPQRVFDPFYTTKPVGKGTGLGLSICFGILQEHAGKILCSNSQEGGAVFRIELPAVLAAFPTKDFHLTGASSDPHKSA